MAFDFGFDLGAKSAKEDYKAQNLQSIGRAVADILDISEDELLNNPKAYVSVIRDLKIKLLIDNKS